MVRERTPPPAPPTTPPTRCALRIAIDVPPREAGRHDLVIAARDSAGNVGTVPGLDYGGPGRHTIAVVAPGGTTLRDRSARTSRVGVIPDAPYSPVPLSDLGGEANALGISPRGDVAGWVAPRGGRRRAAV